MAGSAGGKKTIEEQQKRRRIIINIFFKFLFRRHFFGYYFAFICCCVILWNWQQNHFCRPGILSTIQIFTSARNNVYPISDIHFFCTAKNTWLPLRRNFSNRGSFFLAFVIVKICWISNKSYEPNISTNDVNEVCFRSYSVSTFVWHCVCEHTQLDVFC